MTPYVETTALITWFLGKAQQIMCPFMHVSQINLFVTYVCWVFLNATVAEPVI